MKELRSDGVEAEGDPMIVPRPVHLERPEEPAPVVLHTIDRGAAGEVRIQLKSFSGRRVVDVRIFERRGGALHATEKGIAIRLGELADVARVLRAALVDSTADEAGREHP